MNKKLAIIYSFGFLLIFPAVAMAWTVQSVVCNVVNIVFIFAGAAAVCYFLWYGVMFLMARGNPERVKEARLGVIWGIVGVAFVILAWTIVSFVNTELFNGQGGIGNLKCQ